ncbi:MAG: DUF262 domain-containing protein [Brevinema sp.]
MQAVDSSFSSITSQEKVLRIPFFQRRYVWGEDQWEKLWEDLSESFENGDSHFLGSIILKQVGSQSGSERLVIDGQQRLTTFTILLKATMDILASHDKELLPQLLDPSIFSKQGKDRAVKIEHSKYNRDSFSKVMTINGNIPQDDTDNIISAYHFFNNKLKQMDINDISEFSDKLLTDKIWVHISVGENEDEQRIFDSINTSGVVLSEMDVVKNFLFKFHNDDKMEGASKLYDEAWKPIFDDNENDIAFWDKKVVSGRIERSQADVLLHSIALIEGIYNPSDKGQKLDKIGRLYKEEINKHKNDTKVQDEIRRDTITKILDYAKIFRDLPFLDDVSEYSCDSSPMARFLQIVSALDMSTITPVALYLEYKKEKEQISEDEYKKCLKLLEEYIIRRAIRNLSNKQYNKIVYEILKSVKDTHQIYEAMKDYLTKLEGHSEEFPTKADIQGVSFADFKPRLSRILLFWIELERQGKNKKTGETLSLTYHQYQLEHLMPQKWKTHWTLTDGISEEERNTYINKIGNFTLLKPKLNTQVSNGSWDIKVNGKEIRKKHVQGIKECSKISLSQEVVGYGTWTEQHIDKRTDNLKKEIVDLWCNIE